MNEMTVEELKVMEKELIERALMVFEHPEECACQGCVTERSNQMYDEGLPF